MKIFLVGGAVRDKLLDRPVKERDWVVVGASYEECQQQGWRPVAEGVPVFRDPQSGDEYAMARIERKTGTGYRGFDFDFGSDISLEQDLLRRDLTINALAMDPEGQVVDPLGFAEDIEARLIRHISPKFIEDPVRLVRLCSLYARLRTLGFAVVPATIKLMNSMTSAPNAKEEFASVSPKHLWTQLEKALASDSPEAFVDMLNRSGGATMLLPDELISSKAIARLKLAASRHESAQERLAIWLCPLDSETTAEFLTRYEVPKHYRRLCERLNEFYPFYLVACDKPIPEILEIFKKFDAFADGDAFAKLTTCSHTLVCSCDSSANIPQVQKELLNTMLLCAQRIDRNRILRRNIDGTPQMALEIDKHRCAEMARVRRYYPWSDLSVGKNRPQTIETSG